MKKGTTNPSLRKLIIDLKKTKRPIWRAVAKKLEKASRRRAAVNIKKINKYTKEGDIVIIPGKVLSVGELDHKVTIAALDFSEVALKKLDKTECMKISELLKKNPKKPGIKILV